MSYKQQIRIECIKNVIFLKSTAPVTDVRTKESLYHLPVDRAYGCEFTKK